MSAASININMAANVFGGYAKKMVRPSRPVVEIHLDNHTDGRIYSTFDAIKGRVEITAPQTTRFDEIQITLDGNVATFIEGMSAVSARSRTNAAHNFLKLNMPIRESEYPLPRIAEAGRTYTFQFNFVIPDQLLPRSCTHDVDADHVHQAHLQLPPSMGEKDVTGKEDLSPEMTRVRYAIKTKVLRRNEEDRKLNCLVEGVKKLHVVPAQAEAPPMSLGAGDEHFVLSKTKSLRKGVFSGRLGKITISAPQTGALMLPPSATQSTTPATTMARISLHFEPHDISSQPPRLGGLLTRMKSSTYYSVCPQKELQTRNGTHIEFDPFRGCYETSVLINSRCVDSVGWEKHITPMQRKNSAFSTSSSSDCSETNNLPSTSSGVFFTAAIIVPISLPASKKWLPTFHSCVVSRIYQLDLSLTVHTPGTGVPSTSIALHLPVQIGAAGSGSRRTSLTAAEAAAELADAEEFLRPRVLEIPSEELIGRSVLTVGSRNESELPPSYEDLRVAVAVDARQIVDPGRG